MRQRGLGSCSFGIVVADDKERSAGCVGVIGVVSRVLRRIDRLKFLMNLVVSC